MRSGYLPLDDPFGHVLSLLRLPLLGPGPCPTGADTGRLPSGASS